MGFTFICSLLTLFLLWSFSLLSRSLKSMPLYLHPLCLSRSHSSQFIILLSIFLTWRSQHIIFNSISLSLSLFLSLAVTPCVILSLFVCLSLSLSHRFIFRCIYSRFSYITYTFPLNYLFIIYPYFPIISCCLSFSLSFYLTYLSATLSFPYYGPDTQCPLSPLSLFLFTLSLLPSLSLSLTLPPSLSLWFETYRFEYFDEYNDSFPPVFSVADPPASNFR